MSSVSVSAGGGAGRGGEPGLDRRHGCGACAQRARRRQQCAIVGDDDDCARPGGLAHQLQDPLVCLAAAREVAAHPARVGVDVEQVRRRLARVPDHADLGACALERPQARHQPGARRLQRLPLAQQPGAVQVVVAVDQIALDHGAAHPAHTLACRGVSYMHEELANREGSHGWSWLAQPRAARCARAGARGAAAGGRPRGGRRARAAHGRAAAGTPTAAAGGRRRGDTEDGHGDRSDRARQRRGHRTGRHRAHQRARRGRRALCRARAPRRPAGAGAPARDRLRARPGGAGTRRAPLWAGAAFHDRYGSPRYRHLGGGARLSGWAARGCAADRDRWPCGRGQGAGGADRGGFGLLPGGAHRRAPVQRQLGGPAGGSGRRAGGDQRRGRSGGAVA
ncbi:MAG: hypothetical protein KatS3mg102_2348 [Planctomycetota bacterium]|nr:MAG: hypothetical protein KatS3mg102_2348 [Planctomycetota bacterium]